MGGKGRGAQGDLGGRGGDEGWGGWVREGGGRGRGKPVEQREGRVKEEGPKAGRRGVGHRAGGGGGGCGRCTGGRR